jgi:hypothetical protein
MEQIIKIKCNGAQAHLNEVDLKKAEEKEIVFRGVPAASPQPPERIVLPCRFCAEGKVILTRKMIEDRRKKS